MTEDLIRYVSISRELVPFEEPTGSYLGVPALLSLMKATFNDQELNMPFPNGMGMSSPFVVAALTQCHLFSQFRARSCQVTMLLPIHSMIQGPPCTRMSALKRSH